MTMLSISFVEMGAPIVFFTDRDPVRAHQQSVGIARFCCSREKTENMGSLA